MEATARASRRHRARRGAVGHEAPRGQGELRRARGEVSARIMAPRIVLYATTFVLCAFGLLMIYSSSSILGLTSAEYDNNPAYFVVRQAVFGAVGVVAAVVLAHIDYRVWRGWPLAVAWVLSVGFLVLIYTPLARGAYGATRWISLAGLRLQPSELAKVTILLTAANICERHYREGESTATQFMGQLAIGVGIPLALILLQPDKGTTGVLALTILIMMALSGMPRRYLLAIGAAVVCLALVLAFKDDYSRARVMTMVNPFEDPYGAGYQLVQGFYAFGTGGLLGVGLGLSRQKYSYLPMAHNDFIFAVIGEELGLVGTLGTLFAFALLIWAGLRIAESAPDFTGRLVAAGCTTLIGMQLLLNVCGVLGLFPLSGKPVPFVSYGGTSLISCLMLVGLVASVSRHSTLPTTEADVRRRALRVVGQASAPASRRRHEPARRAEAPQAPAHPRGSARSRGARDEERGAGLPQKAAPAPRPPATLRLVEGGRGRAHGPGESPRAGREGDGAARLGSEEALVRGGRPTRRRR